MRAVIVLAVVFAILHFGLKYCVTPKLGDDVKARFVERLKYIPSFRTSAGTDNEAVLNRANLAAWLGKPDLQSFRRGYAFPVLFPLDILFLLALGSLLGMVSQMLAGQVGAISGWPVWIWWLFPVAYMACDLLEDVLLIALLTMPSRLNDGTFGALTTFTGGKIATVKVAIGQVGSLAFAWAAARLGVIG